MNKKKNDSAWLARRRKITRQAGAVKKVEKERQMDKKRKMREKSN